MIQRMEKQSNKFNYFAYPEIIRIMKPHKIMKMDMYELLIIVCNFRDQDIDIIRQRTRKREIVVTRQIYCYFASKYCHKALREIGDTIGYDHATVLHGKKQIENIQEFDINFASEISKIDIFLKKLMEDNFNGNKNK